MEIYGDWDCYIKRQKADDWPDIWSEGYERWMRPHKLSVQFRQAGEPEPHIVRITAMCQKRWKNSKRLSDIGTWHTVGVWERAGDVPEWVKPYISAALDRIRPVLRETGQGTDKYLAKIFDSAGDTVSGLSLEGCGEDGHAVANKLWKISAYLRRRGAGEAA